MMVNIFHAVVLSVLLQLILTSGEQGLGIFFFCNSKQIQICILFFLWAMQVGQVLFRMCVCMHKDVAHVHEDVGEPTLCFLLTPTVNMQTVVCMRLL